MDVRSETCEVMIIISKIKRLDIIVYDALSSLHILTHHIDLTYRSIIVNYAECHVLNIIYGMFLDRSNFSLKSRSTFKKCMKNKKFTSIL